MDHMLQRIGLELRRRYASSLRTRMDWKMIDAFARLQEREEAETDAVEPRQDVPPRLKLPE